MNKSKVAPTGDEREQDSELTMAGLISHVNEQGEKIVGGLGKSLAQVSLLENSEEYNGGRYKNLSYERMMA